MFVFDVETLSVESNAVVLSAALVYFNPADKPDYSKLMEDSIFVKFDSKEQIENLKRTISKSTLDWWKTQEASVQKTSLIPNRELDVTAKEGVQQLHDFMAKYPNATKQTMWSRGSLDQLAIDSLARVVELDTITGFWMWRDVRTAVDVLYGSNNGYTNVSHETFNKSDVIKHDPVHDCAYDAMMLMYGIPKGS